jgi:hypothetical protein
MNEQSRTTTDPEVVIIHPACEKYAEERYSPPPVGLDPHPFNIAEYEAIPVDTGAPDNSEHANAKMNPSDQPTDTDSPAPCHGRR